MTGGETASFSCRFEGLKQDGNRSEGSNEVDQERHELWLHGNIEHRDQAAKLTVEEIVVGVANEIRRSWLTSRSNFWAKKFDTGRNVCHFEHREGRKEDKRDNNVDDSSSKVLVNVSLVALNLYPANDRVR